MGKRGHGFTCSNVTSLMEGWILFKHEFQHYNYMNLAVGRTLNRHKVMSEKSSAVKSGIIPVVEEPVCIYKTSDEEFLCVHKKKHLYLQNMCTAGGNGGFW